MKSFLIVAFASLASLASLEAADGTWVNPDNSFAGTNDWNNAADWTGGIIAGGTDAVADFTADLYNNEDTIITVDSGRTVG